MRRIGLRRCSQSVRAFTTQPAFFFPRGSPESRQRSFYSSSHTNLSCFSATAEPAVELVSSSVPPPESLLTTGQALVLDSQPLRYLIVPPLSYPHRSIHTNPPGRPLALGACRRLLIVSTVGTNFLSTPPTKHPTPSATAGPCSDTSPQGIKCISGDKVRHRLPRSLSAGAFLAHRRRPLQRPTANLLASHPR